MPIQPLAPVIDALFFARADGPWLENTRDFLRELSRGRPGRDQRENPDSLRVVMHMDVLEQRLAGDLRWDEALDRGAASRRYGDMVEIGGQLPRYEWAPIYLTADLFNPRNESACLGWDPTYEVFELLASTNVLFPWQRGILLDGSPIRPRDPGCYAKMSAYGTAFGDAMALGCEKLAPHFACADLKSASTFWARAVATLPESEARQVRFWDYLWPLSYWSPALLAERPGLAERLESLHLSPQERLKIDAFEQQGIEISTRRLKTGGLFVQYRTILGTELRTSRGTVDEPLARRVGLKPLL